mmetsp:Transcript_45989/g.80800  ORF Transcript_45989/g.80800 Transcript_45989/m.80800 type:complete len:223 (+) Transcript_45989:90-758(+)
MGNDSSTSRAEAKAQAAEWAPAPVDYYEVLGVRYDADAETLRKACQREAKKWSPSSEDGRRNKAYFENRFRLVSEAYQVLSNPIRRDQYNQYGPAGVQDPLKDPVTFYREFHDIAHLAENTCPREVPPHQVYINEGHHEAFNINEGSHDAFDIDDALLEAVTMQASNIHAMQGSVDDETALHAAIQASNMHQMQGGMDDDAALQAALKASMSQHGSLHTTDI